MTREELINELETMRKSVANDLTYVNAKHDVLANMLCSLNNLLANVHEDDLNGRSVE